MPLVFVSSACAGKARADAEGSPRPAGASLAAGAAPAMLCLRGGALQVWSCQILSDNSNKKGCFVFMKCIHT